MRGKARRRRDPTKSSVVLDFRYKTRVIKGYQGIKSESRKAEFLKRYASRSKTDGSDLEGREKNEPNNRIEGDANGANGL